MQPNGWLPEYTTDLLDLLNVIGRLIALEPKREDLLNRICAGPLREHRGTRRCGGACDARGGLPQEKSQKQALIGNRWG